jgi:bifunctional non-homologous end joining protein LigD
MRWRDDPAKIRPMLATLAQPPLAGAGLVFEPKYDGIRALIHVEPRRGGASVRIWSRLGNEKTSQFPAITAALAAVGAKWKGPVLLDGEIVALDAEGRPAGFQHLQGRIHLSDARDIQRIEAQQPVALIAFDVLRDGDDDVRGLPLTERRQRLERLLGAAGRGRTRKTTKAPTTGAAAATIRISEQVAADGHALHTRALSEGWEGLIVKEARSPYHSGRRSPSWRKLKVVNEQEFVIGGWTEPRQTRQHFGALLLGVHEAGGLKYVGHTGTGFDQKELARVSRLLRARATTASPFSERIKTNEPAHWVTPDLVAQIRFTEWTADQKLRHPVYLGLRDDKAARDVRREAPAGAVAPRPARGKALPASARQPAKRSAPLKRAAPKPGADAPAIDPDNPVVEQLRALEDARRDGSVELPDGSRLGVTNLAKPFWPKLKLTKGDLLRYYATVAPLQLPAVEDRPLVMKRFPNGIDGMAFYQQRSRLEKPPAGVRIETIADDVDPISEPDARRFIGGSLITLLYMTQIAAISQDPWFSRVQSPLEADYVAIDLDPTEGAPFARVLEVARLVHAELESLQVPSVPKTSGSSGLHIYIPLAPGTTYESGMLFCQIVATVIAAKHPKIATVERTVRARRKGTIYVDYLQNILGKTLATAYSARASDYAGVSTPLTWDEVFDDIDPHDFTIRTAPARFAKVGDLWARLRTSTPADLEAVFRKYA